MAELGGSALFAARFRENAARALLLPRRRPGQRTPLWMQRQKSADLLAVASQYGSFPIVLETYREVLRDVFDVPALIELLGAIRSRQIRVISVESRSASPFASSLMFDYLAVLHVRGRRAAGRAAGAGAGAGSRPAGRAARVGGAARAARPRGRRRARARAPGARRSPPRPHARRLSPTCCAGSATSNRRDRGAHDRWPRRRRCAARARGGPDARCACGSAARSAGSRSRTWPATATRSAPRRRPACAETWLAASRRAAGRAARALGPDPRARSPPTRRPPAGACRAAPSRSALQALVGDRHAARGRVPARVARHTSSPTPRCSASCAAARWPACAARSSRCEPGARPLPARLAWCRIGCRRDSARLIEVDRPARGRADSRVGPGARRPARPRRRLHAPSARRAGRRGRAGLGRSRRAGTGRRTHGPLSSRPRRSACNRRHGRRPAGGADP